MICSSSAISSLSWGWAYLFRSGYPHRSSLETICVDKEPPESAGEQWALCLKQCTPSSRTPLRAICRRPYSQGKTSNPAECSCYSRSLYWTLSCFHTESTSLSLISTAWLSSTLWIRQYHSHFWHLVIESRPIFPRTIGSSSRESIRWTARSIL